MLVRAKNGLLLHYLPHSGVSQVENGTEILPVGRTLSTTASINSVFREKRSEARLYTDSWVVMDSLAGNRILT